MKHGFTAIKVYARWTLCAVGWLLLPAWGWADACIAPDSPLFAFVDDVFLQTKTEKQMYDSYKRVKKQLNAPLELAYLDYYLGRYHQALKSLSEMEKYDRCMLKGKVFQLSELFPDRERAVKIYEKVLAACAKNSDRGEGDPLPWFLLETRTVAELCLIAGTDYLLANGLEVPKRAQKVLRHRPDCARAQLIAANQHVFSNKIWGGSPKKALSILTAVRFPPNPDKELLLDYYNDLAYSYGRLKEYEIADDCSKKALALYPSNVQANFIWSKIQKKGF